MVTAYLGLLLLVAGQRLLELVVSARNARWAFARGGRESGAGDLPMMKLLHTAFLVSCAIEVVWFERAFRPAVGVPMLVCAIAAQGLRLWSMRALGPWWNTRIITAPGMQIVNRGPYHFVRHPNYLAVVIEGVALPLVHGAGATASWFSLANAWFLRRRIRCEERALARDGVPAGATESVLRPPQAAFRTEAS